MRYNWLYDVVEKQVMKLKKIHNDNNLSNRMTKVVPKEKFVFCIKLTGMSSNYGVGVAWCFCLDWRGRLLWVHPITLIGIEELNE